MSRDKRPTTEPHEAAPARGVVSRRAFLKGAGVAATAASLHEAARAATEGAGGKPAGVVEADERVDVQLRLNGQPRKLTVLPKTSLADAIRATGLTGTKIGCDGGACGACTLHVDGAPRVGCLTFAAEVDGSAVTTIEGVSAAELHPVQRAILQADALQCGYCTPGFVMAGIAFYDAHRRAHGATRPARNDVVTALAGNLCRCGCQPALIEAVSAACAGVAAVAPGGPVPRDDVAVARADGPEKVRGAARYTFDITLPHMLHAVLVGSPVAAGVLRAVDDTACRAVPGFVAVDLSPIAREQGFGKLRYSGQPIAAVCADSPEAAARSALRLRLDVVESPAAIDPDDAAKDGAPVVFGDSERDEVRGGSEAPKAPEFLVRWRGNVRGPALYEFEENIDDELAGAPVRVSLSARTQVQFHASLERHVVVVEPSVENGKQSLVVHASTQVVEALAHDLAERLDLPRAQVRVNGRMVGGAFGAKAGLRVEHVAAARLALQTKRPVRLVYSLAQHLEVGGNRPGSAHVLDVGASSDGTLRAIRHHGRTHSGISVGERSTGLTAVHYPGARVSLVDVGVVTNTAPGCQFRAPGFPPNCFALEQAVDDVARQTEQDPLLMRIRQDPDPRRRAVYRRAHDAWAARGVAFDRARAAGDARFARGRGVATSEWFVLTAPQLQVELRAERNGTLLARCAVHDMGQGARTVMLNILHESLRLPAERIAVDVGGSELPTGCGAFGSLTTSSLATATARAAQALQAELVRAAHAHGGAGVVTPDGVLQSGELSTWASLFARLPQETVTVSALRGDDHHGFAIPPVKLGALAGVMPGAITKDLATSVQIAEVTVDRWLGEVHVDHVTVVLDAGRVASPLTARSQVVGAALQGVSRALYEERVLDPQSGLLLSRSFESYGIAGVADAPDVDVVFVEQAHKNSPHGAFGLGENSTVATCAAVANAVRDALGVRVLETPMTPRKVRAALAAAAKTTTNQTPATAAAVLP